MTIDDILDAFAVGDRRPTAEQLIEWGRALSIPRLWQVSDPATPLPADAACGPGAVLPLSDFRPGDVGEGLGDLDFSEGYRFKVIRHKDTSTEVQDAKPHGWTFWMKWDARARLISRAPNVQSDGPEIEEPPASLRESRERHDVRARTLTSRMTTSEAFAADAVIVDNGPHLTVDVPMITSYVVDLQQLRRAVSDATGCPVNAPIEVMCEAARCLADAAEGRSIVVESEDCKGTIRTHSHRIEWTIDGTGRPIRRIVIGPVTVMR